MVTSLIRAKRPSVSDRLLKAMETADSRGYTGMVGSKGHLLEDPLVKRLMAKRDRDAMIGKRIELHPGMDLWMRGVRYGNIVSVTSKGTYRVKLDKWPRVISVPQDRLTFI